MNVNNMHHLNMSRIQRFTQNHRF